MTQPKNREELKAALIAKIQRLREKGKDASGQILALTRMMAVEQDRLLRTKSNQRFGRLKARELRKAGGEFAFKRGHNGETRSTTRAKE